MRTLKFRAWDKEKKIMVYLEKPLAIAFDGNVVFDSGNGFVETTKKYIPLQFTGLTDRNGKEIYEGDIVRCFMNGEEHSLNVIKWADYGYTMTDFEDESGERVLWFCEVEVIGNIWKNPDLINKK